MPKIKVEGDDTTEAEHEIDTGPITADAVLQDAAPPPAVPFVHTAPQNKPPTQEQHDWLRAHPDYVRISHAVLGRFRNRGTLTPEGDFVSENIRPILDGAGSFGVGVP